MANFLIVTSEFPPEPGSSGRMASDVAQHLAQNGHMARVVCPYPSRPAGTVYPTSHERRLTRDRTGGVTVVRVPSFRAPQSRFLARMFESWSFGRWSSRMLTLDGIRPDAIYSSTWPMLAQAWITAAASRHGIPHLGHVMDLYPESALLKVSRPVQCLAGGLLLALDRWNAAHLSRLLVISENMRRAYISGRRIPPERVDLVPVWQDETPFGQLPSRSQAASAYDVRGDQFTFLYLGNIGPVAGVDHLIRSFARSFAQLREGPQLIIVGEGSEKPKCDELARRCGANIRFLSDPKIENVPLLQSLADVCLLPVKKGAAFSSIPSKLCAYLLSGKPILASVDPDSDSAHVIQSLGCGWVVAPEDDAMLSSKMREILASGARNLENMGNAGRRYALSHLSKTRGVERLSEMLVRAAAPSNPTQSLNVRPVAALQ